MPTSVSLLLTLRWSKHRRSKILQAIYSHCSSQNGVVKTYSLSFAVVRTFTSLLHALRWTFQHLQVTCTLCRGENGRSEHLQAWGSKQTLQTRKDGYTLPAGQNGRSEFLQCIYSLCGSQNGLLELVQGQNKPSKHVRTTIPFVLVKTDVLNLYNAYTRFAVVKTDCWNLYKV